MLIFTRGEEDAICKRVIFATKREQLATMVRKSGIEKFPQIQQYALFGARNRTVTYRATENKDINKLKGKRFEHVHNYFALLGELSI